MKVTDRRSPPKASRYQGHKLLPVAQMGPICIVPDPFLAPSRAHHFLQTSQGFVPAAEDRIEAAHAIQNGGMPAVQVEGSPAHARAVFLRPSRARRPAPRYKARTSPGFTDNCCLTTTTASRRP